MLSRNSFCSPLYLCITFLYLSTKLFNVFNNVVLCDDSLVAIVFNSVTLFNASITAPNPARNSIIYLPLLPLLIPSGRNRMHLPVRSICSLVHAA